MTHARLLSLPPAPPSLEDSHGHPRFGTWQGELNEVALHRLRGPFSLPAPLRFLKRKRWTYAQIVTPEVVVAVAVVHLGYTSNAFVSVLDRRSRMAVFDDSYLGLPGTRAQVNDFPGDGHDAFFRRPDAQVSLKRAQGSGRYVVDASLRQLFPLGDSLQLHAELLVTGAPPALSVVAPVTRDGVVNATQKRAAMSAQGSLTIGKRSWSLDGGIAGMDYTQGYLGRHTTWRWAMGNGRLEDGTALGFNLVEGINDAAPACNENALWIGDALFPLPRARFRFDRDRPGGGPWEIETVDGSARLTFEPLHLHREARDYKLVRSRFVQPLGVFNGTFRVAGRTVAVRDVGGVTEDQDVVW